MVCEWVNGGIKGGSGVKEWVFEGGGGIFRVGAELNPYIYNTGKVPVH